MTTENHEVQYPLHLIRNDVFTLHQAEIVELLINGAKHQEIAQNLSVSCKTIEGTIYKKLDEGSVGIWERTTMATGEEIPDITAFIRVLYKHHIVAFNNFTPPILPETPEQTQAFLDSLQAKLAQIRQETDAPFNFPAIPLERESVLV